MIKAKFKILSIDLIERQMLLDWGYVKLNHWIPPEFFGNPDMSMDDVINRIHEDQPPEPDKDDWPDALFEMLEQTSK